MFKCLACNYEGNKFHAGVAGFYQGDYAYRAKCPKCGSTKIEPIIPLKEQELRISIERR